MYTFEIDPEFIQIAKSIIDLALLQDLITVVQINLYLDGSIDDIATLTEIELRGNKMSGSLQIHFLFLDHDKDRYLLDLKRLEQSYLIKQGTCVVADNVIFAHIVDYIQYMKQLQDTHVARTKTIESSVEYSYGRIEDGLGTCKSLSNGLKYRISEF